MANENSINENYSDFKKCLACGKHYGVVEEFINHTKDPWHDELIISSYSRYIEESEVKKIVEFIEDNKNRLIEGKSNLRIYLAGTMIYNVLTTKPREAMNNFINDLF